MNWRLNQSLFVAFSVAAMIAVGHPSSLAEGVVAVQDVRRPERIVLSSQCDPIDVSVVELRVTGFLAGRAKLIVKNHEPITLTGNINTGLGVDHFAANCEVQYVPDEVMSGELRIHYSFQ